MPNTKGDISSFDNVRTRPDYAVVKDTTIAPPAYATTQNNGNEHQGTEMFKGFPGNKKAGAMSGLMGAKGKVSS